MEPRSLQQFISGVVALLGFGAVSACDKPSTQRNSQDVNTPALSQTAEAPDSRPPAHPEPQLQIDEPAERKWLLKQTPILATYQGYTDSDKSVLLGVKAGNALNLQDVSLSDLSNEDRAYIDERIAVRAENGELWKQSGLPICKKVLHITNPNQLGVTYAYKSGKVLEACAKELNCKTVELRTLELPKSLNTPNAPGAWFTVTLIINGESAQRKETERKLEERLRRNAPYLVDHKNQKYTCERAVHGKDSFTEYGCQSMFEIATPLQKPMTLVLPWGEIRLSERPTRF